MRNEKGSTLILVLIVMLVFSVLGVSIMSKVISESKQTVKSEKEVQARYLAESGLVHFEQDYRNFLEDSTSDIVDYHKEDIIGNHSAKEQSQIMKVEKVADDADRIKVYSQGRMDDVVITVVGTYKFIDDIEIEIDDKTHELADFTAEGALAIDFSKFNVVDLGLGSLLNLNLINAKGSDKKFYTVPNDDVVSIGILGPILGISIGDGDRFNTMEESSVIATRRGVLLKLDLLSGNREKGIVSINLLDYQDEDDTNVLINGYFEAFKLLGIPLVTGHRHIDFYKFASLGSVIIQQDKQGLITRDDASRRYFSFREGLYVNRTLVIGDEKNRTRGSLGIIGDMVAMDDLRIKNVDLQVSERDGSQYKVNTEEDAVMNMFVHGNVSIEDSCIHLKDSNYDFRIYTKGKITLKNNGDCDTYPGFYYAEGGIDLYAEGKEVIFDGSVVGDINLKDSGSYKVEGNHELSSEIETRSIDLIPVGRELE